MSRYDTRMGSLMEVFRDLMFLAIDPRHVDDFIARTAGVLPTGWTYGGQGDPGLQGMIGRDAVFHYFPSDAV